MNQQDDQPLILPNDHEPDDSGVEDLASSTASLSSTVLWGEEENGRRYHALHRGKYILPDDEIEQGRLDLMHHIWCLSLDDKLLLCPKYGSAKNVLDVGTGTGSWAIDFADDNPDARVVGVDLSPIQPNFVPPNCEFQVDDVEEEWTWRDLFDVIFIRSLIGSLADWEELLHQAYSHLEDDGYLEIQDDTYPLTSDDGTLDGTALYKWSEMMRDAASKSGRPLDVAPQFKEMMERAGFKEIQVEKFRVPVGPWPKDRGYNEIGRFVKTMLEEHLAGLSLALFTRSLGWSTDKVQVFLTEVRKDLKNPSIHGYSHRYVVYGKK